MSYIADLKQRVIRAEEERDYYKSLVETFFTGDIPDRASINHFIIAKWGRRRLDEQRCKPALLRTD